MKLLLFIMLLPIFSWAGERTYMMAPKAATLPMNHYNVLAVAIDEFDAKEVRPLKGTDVITLKMTPEKAKSFIKEHPEYIVEEDQLAYVQGLVKCCAGDCDEEDEQKEEMPLQWWVTQTRADTAWAKGTGKGIRIAVIDTGIDKDHSVFKGALKGCYSVIQSEPHCEDEHGHGTHVSSISGARGIFRGIAPDADMISIKVLKKNGSGTYSDIAAGIGLAIEKKAHIINLSLGGSGPSQILQNVIEMAHRQGIWVVVAAGNSGPPKENQDTSVIYPARYCGGYDEGPCLAVSALTKSDHIASFSSRGKEVSLGAYGQSIFAACMNDRFCTKSGSSMAAPIVSGVLALMLEAGVKSIPCTRALPKLTSHDRGVGMIAADLCVM